jgi:hypothetical protein
MIMQKMKLFHRENRRTLTFLACVCALFVISCRDGAEGPGAGTPYDPSKPITLKSFSPDSGGMATKVMIHGANFGTDPKAIKVYYNQTRAGVVGSNGEYIYVMTPRQPGEICDISVVVGKDSMVFPNQQFKYSTMVTVATLAGQKGTAEFKGGTLAEATFHSPSTLCVDAEGNIFLSHWIAPYCFVVINEEKDMVQAVLPGSTDGVYALGAPTADADGRVIMAPTDGGDGYYSFDPDAQWAPKLRSILHPTAEDQANGMKDFSINWKHGMSACKLDGKIYTRAYSGQLIRYDPMTRTGEMVAEGLQVNSDSFLYFHPYQENILFITYPSRHAIYAYDVLTNEHTLFAGTLGVPGWRDGNRLDAEFRGPRQVVVDTDGSVIVADALNHCIRKITPDGMVSTIIGKGGISGYQDGNPEDALFNNPQGVAIDSGGNIYIADRNNNCIRKLAIQ